MPSFSTSAEPHAGVTTGAGERRKNPRFHMRVPVYLRALGERWMTTETADVSAAGAFFVTARPLLLHAPLEYVLTFAPELTKATRPLLVRFFGRVLRCERSPEGEGLYGVAVTNTTHRYLTAEEASHFEAMTKEQPSMSSPKP